jgi:hypothetical protein
LIDELNRKGRKEETAKHHQGQNPLRAFAKNFAAFAF